METVNTLPLARTGNRLLDRLSNEELGGLKSSWELVALRQAEEIYRPDGPLSYVYFPITGLYAVVVRMQDGKVVEAGTVGNEGMLGVTSLLDLDFSTMSVTTPVPGDCLRIPLAAFRCLSKPGGSFDRILRRYAAFALLSAHQTVACNAVHSAEERMCRWLLTNHDRLRSSQMMLTQEFLAQLLGVRRQTVTAIAGTLEAEGLIASRRGLVQIVNRIGLEACACECYLISKSVYARVVCGENN
jgi:CRP-like cAMP-binding protein